MSAKPCKRISMWSGPRNVSTALMYAFAQRPDTRVVDEPLYGHYLRVSGAEHPGAEEVMASMDCIGNRVTRDVMLGPCDRSVVFFKNMTHHLVDLDLGFLSQTTNVLLTRSPVEMLPSLAQNLAAPTQRDTGYQMQVELLEMLIGLGQNPPILDARELLLNPSAVLQQLCEHLDIPFSDKMLHWPAGPKPEDGVWAKYWYDNVHRSTSFMKYRPKTQPFPDHLRPLLEECLPYYNQLLALAIKA